MNMRMKSRRVKGASPSSPPADEYREALRPLFDVLAGPDEGRRRRAVRSVQEEATPPVRELVVDGLVDRLGGKAEAARASAASLEEIGAVPDLLHRLLTARGAALQVRLVEVLARVGAALPPGRRPRLQRDLDIFAAQAQGPEVLAALDRAQLALRPDAATAG